MWISSRNHGTFRELDASSHFTSTLDHHERQHLINRSDPIVKRVMPTRRSTSCRYSRRSWIVGLLLGHVTSSIAERNTVAIGRVRELNGAHICHGA